MNKFLKLIVTLAFFGTPSILSAQNPSLSTLEGSKTYGSGINLDSCRINILTVGYKLGTLNNQPTVYSNIKWKGKDINSTCLANEKFEIFLSIGTDTTAKYIYAGSSSDVIVGKGNYEWGNHPYSATVSWDSLVTKNFGKSDAIHFANEEDARVIWNQGFIVKNVKVVTEKGRVFILK